MGGPEFVDRAGTSSKHLGPMVRSARSCVQNDGVIVKFKSLRRLLLTLIKAKTYLRSCTKVGQEERYVINMVSLVKDPEECLADIVYWQ